MQVTRAAFQAVASLNKQATDPKSHTLVKISLQDSFKSRYLLNSDGRPLGVHSEDLCSFCGRLPSEFEAAFGGHKSRICGDCVRKYFAILEKDKPDVS